MGKGKNLGKVVIIDFNGEIERGKEILELREVGEEVKQWAFSEDYKLDVLRDYGEYSNLSYKVVGAEVF